MAPSDDFDYSTPEGRESLADITGLVLDIRTEIDRKTRLYERTLGLAVIPVLLKRAALLAYRRLRSWRQST